MIEFRGVEKQFGSHASALQNVSIKIPKSATHAILGPSGCGKSTLARLASGLIEPTHGEVLIGGQRLNSLPVSERAGLVGFMTQEGGLFPHLTCRQNVLLPMLIHSLDAMEARYDELRELVGLPEATLARYPQQVSGGQRQRVSLMRALALSPPVLILDEPMGALDPIVRNELQEQLRAIFARLGTTVMLVTHDLSEAAFLAASVTLLNAGRLVQSGRIENLIANPADEFVQKFMNAQRPPPVLAQWNHGGQS